MFNVNTSLLSQIEMHLYYTLQLSSNVFGEAVTDRLLHPFLKTTMDSKCSN
jgi:hypothetical protein